MYLRGKAKSGTMSKYDLVKLHLKAIILHRRYSNVIIILL